MSTETPYFIGQSMKSFHYFTLLLLVLGGCQRYSKQHTFRITLHYDGRYQFKGSAEFKMRSGRLQLGVDQPENEYVSIPISQLPTTLTFTRLMSEDERNAFWNGHIVAESDPTKFYTQTEPGSDNKVFEFRVREDLGSGYGRDGSGIYAGSVKLENCDPGSFQVIPGAKFGRDNQRVYHGVQLIENADPASFEILTQDYQRDRHRAYYRGKPLPGTLGADFEVIGERGGYGRDKSSVFHFGEPLPNVDAGSFAILSDAFTKDKNGVYVYNKPLAGVDLATFKALDESIFNEYAVDAFRAYFRDRMIPNADPNRFRILSRNTEGERVMGAYATDEVSVFFEGNAISGADAATFQVIAASYGVGSQDPIFRAKDKNRTYREGSVESAP
jgi:hypothetical protein